ncbi:MAG: hypothetical protein O2819_06130 [Planctomycetota bacterium]|nr:hypothetical protein [Planctomycetota bacterium]MDA1106427.1 hypothetical protein [Planctomycetota bacterium]
MIQTRLQPRFKYWTLAYAILCLGFGIWGGYDYWVTIPEQQALVDAYREAELNFHKLDFEGQSRPLTDDEHLAKRNATEFMNAYPARPTEIPAWDRPLQLWAYVIGCGVVGFPWCAWTLWSTSRRVWRLNDDGSMDTPTGTIASHDITDIDMSRWMAKSIVTVKTADGGDIVLDDYKHKNVDTIAVALADRFHPGEWTKKGRPVRSDEDEESAEEGEAAGETDGEAAGETDGETDGEASRG